MNKLRIGIIGAGGISHMHALGYRAIPELVEIAAVCDLNLPRAQEWAAKYGVANAYGSYDEMLKKEKLDAVSVCIWNNGHAPATIAALKAGVHVLCEKPMALNRNEAVAMQKAAERSGKLLMIGFVRRFGQNTKLVSEFMASGAVGDVFLAKASCIRRCGNPGGWFSDRSLSGGGPLIDLGVHIIDLCRFLMGKPEAVRVSGATFNGLGPRDNIQMLARYRAAGGGDVCDVEDIALGMVRFSNGAVLQIETSFSSDIKEDFLGVTLQGTKGGVEIEPGLAFRTQMNDYLVDVTPHVTLDADPFAGNFTREIAHYVDCIRNGTPCLSPAEDGVALMGILDALYESAAKGCEVAVAGFEPEKKTPAKAKAASKAVDSKAVDAKAVDSKAVDSKAVDATAAKVKSAAVKEKPAGKTAVRGKKA